MGEAERFNATLGALNAPQASEAWPYIRDGQPVPEPLRTAVGDYIGAGNYWITNQESFVPVGYTKDASGNFVKAGGPVTPPSGDPIARCKARQAVSNNCLWVLITPEESGALEAAGVDTHVYNQFYTVGGSGGLGMNEQVDSSSPSGYIFVTIEQERVPDVDQAADKYIAKVAADQGRTVPPPANIP